MMSFFKSFLTAAAVFSVFLPMAVQAVTPPGIMNHQGRITVDGTNYTGTGYFKFAFLQTVEPFLVTTWSNDGTNLGEPAAAVPVDVVNGHYAVLLGDTSLTNMTTAIPATVFSENAEVSLHIWFSTDGMTFEPLSPERRLTTSAYAFSAAEIDGGKVKNPAFFGTTGSSALEIKVDDQRALRIQPGSDSSGGPFAPPSGVSGPASIVAGYADNSVSGGLDGATIGGGGGFEIFPDFSSGDPAATIRDERPNIIEGSGSYATIGGGWGNLASARQATVGGGSFNEATGTSSTIAGGSSNTASRQNSTVGGGAANTADGDTATIGGGFGNQASGLWATIPGGRSNMASGEASFAAGRQADALHDGTFVWADSSTTDFASTGADQFLIRADGGVGIGTNNPQAALDVVGTVRASAFESASGSPLTLSTTDNQPIEFGVNASRGFRLQRGASELNVLDQNSGFGSPSLVGGYSLNSIAAGANGATISGGGGNAYSFGELDEQLPNQITILGEFGTISGGRGNTVDDKGAAISGGESNVASGEFSTVSGGRDNLASGDYSFAAGRRAKSIHVGAFVWADSTDADFASTADNQFAIHADGGVRIFDRTDPTLLLQSDGTNEPSGRLSFRQINNTGYDIVYDGVSDVLAFEGYTSGTSGGTALSLDLDGNVGVNTSDPQGNLHIVSDAAVQMILEADTDNVNENDQPSIRMSQDGGVISGSIGFFDGGNRFEIRTEDFGGGATDLVLAPDGAIRLDSDAGINVVADREVAAMFVRNTSTSANADGLWIQLGNQPPGSSNDYVQFFNGNGLVTGQIEGTGSGTVRYQTTSDRRLKQDIVDLSGALAIVGNLQPREYAYRIAPDRRQAGFIAQEILKVYPQATSGDPEGDVDDEPMMVDYSAFTPVLTGAIKELHSIVQSQQERIDALKDENAALHERLLRLEAAINVSTNN